MKKGHFWEGDAVELWKMVFISCISIKKFVYRIPHEEVEIFEKIFLPFLEKVIYFPTKKVQISISKVMTLTEKHRMQVYFILCQTAITVVETL